MPLPEGNEPTHPVFAHLTSLIEELGPDVSAERGPQSVAYSRGSLFAVVEPSTPTRIDVGLVLPEAEETERLRPAGSFGSDRVTHRVSLAHEDEIDAELTDWLRAAYSGAAT